MKRIQLYIDRLLNKKFNNGIICVEKFHENGQPAKVYYRRFPSTPIAPSNTHFNIEIGEKHTIVYTFDLCGNVVSRERLINIFKLRGKPIVGQMEVHSAVRRVEAIQSALQRLMGIPGLISVDRH